MIEWSSGNRTRAEARTDLELEIQVHREFETGRTPPHTGTREFAFGATKLHWS